MAFNEQIHASTRPTIFELLAQESMEAALRPAIQHLCKVSLRRCVYRIAGRGCIHVGSGELTRPFTKFTVVSIL